MKLLNVIFLERSIHTRIGSPSRLRRRSNDSFIQVGLFLSLILFGQPRVRRCHVPRRLTACTCKETLVDIWIAERSVHVIIEGRGRPDSSFFWCQSMWCKNALTINIGIVHSLIFLDVFVQFLFLYSQIFHLFFNLIFTFLSLFSGNVFVDPRMNVIMAHQLQQVLILSAQFNKKQFQTHCKVVLIMC